MATIAAIFAIIVFVAGFIVGYSVSQQQPAEKEKDPADWWKDT